MCLEKKIAKIPYFYFIKSLGKNMAIDVYLVGGFLRDLYLKKTDCFDFDFALERNVFEFARRFSKKIDSKLHLILFRFDCRPPHCFFY